MNVQRFRDDDRGYLDWIVANPAGFVINIQRSLNSGDARLHHASCWTIDPRRICPNCTGAYIKLCSLNIAELDRWATERTRSPVARCGTCSPSVRSAAPSQHHRSSSEHHPEPVRVSTLSASATEIRGPLIERPVIEAWIDEYIRFEHRPAEQEQLRSEIRTRVRQLEAAPGQVLHATYLGAKHPAADVENLVLYNIDDTGASFLNAARFGLRFELAPRCPKSPAGRQYGYGYRYELAPRGAGFEHWREERELAAWDWIELRRFAGDKRLAQIWLALARTAIHVASPVRTSTTPFTLKVSIRTPRGTSPVLGGLVKGIFDGVVCAFQAHTDRTSVTELATRASSYVSASPDEIEALLVSEDKAVLGAVPRLLHKRLDGVIWAPGDDLCVAGELLAEQAPTSTWAIKGRILEVKPAPKCRRQPNRRDACWLPLTFVGFCRRHPVRTTGPSRNDVARGEARRRARTGRHPRTGARLPLHRQNGRCGCDVPRAEALPPDGEPRGAAPIRDPCGLPDDYTVYCNCAWTARPRPGRRIEPAHEADFIIAHPDCGILVVEVKGGDIRYDPRTSQWYKNEQPLKEPIRAGAAHPLLATRHAPRLGR